MSLKRLFASTALVAFGLLAFFAPVVAAYPERPISVLVTYNPGGSNDTIARVFAPELKKILGQPVVVTNRGGAGGTIGVNELLAKPADGYWIGFTCSATLSFDAQTRRVPYDMHKIKYLGTIGIQQMNINAPVDAPYNNLTELLAYAKQNNKSLSIASPITTEMYWVQYLAHKTGVNFRFVPTKSGGEAMSQVLGKHVDLADTGGPEDPYVKAGKLKRIVSMFPGKMVGSKNEVQSLAEAGFPEIGCMAAYHFFASPDMPDDIAAQLEKAILTVAKSPSFVTYLNENSFAPLTMTGKETTDMIEKQIVQYSDLIKLVEGLKSK